MPPILVSSLQKCICALNSLQTYIGKSLCWLIFFMTLVVSVVLIARFFDLGSTALQETITYMHAILFMLTLGYTAHTGGHVRVDIFYRGFSNEGKAWVDLFGSCVFLLPFAVFLFFISWHTAAQSWLILEGSINPGGLPFVYLLKSLAPLAGFLLALHAISDIFKQLLTVSLRSA